MPGEQLGLVPRSTREYIVSLLVRRGSRISILLFMTYVTGMGGIVLSLLGDPADPRAIYGVVGIALMGVSFCSLFVLSVIMVNLLAGE